MEKLNSINWKQVITEIVLPHLGTLTLYIVLYCILGFVLGIVYNVILWKKNIFVREHKYYNWFVKLYIPALFFIFLYFSVQFAFIFGAKKIIKDEEATVVSEIYEASIAEFFETPEERENFILKLQKSSADLQNEVDDISKEANNYLSKNNTGYTIIDTGKNKLTSYIVKEYNASLYSAILYGLVKATGSTTKLEEINKMSYNDVNKLVDTLNTLDPKDIETSIKTKLTEAVDKIISAQINGFAKTTLIIFLLLISIPIIECFIYRWWLKRKIKATETSTT